ncbi:integrin alpha-PS3-like isoform X2 [Penaeus chinensis]|uniref:integrin alpha-PS3-like isoform X2 n=1 Tax=Penaeus chinensis TaxID=139456 RepID=UPI001FB76199|nr:integrin alpha-PS3-like isoform X2 [Penaeus chinensis]
MKAMQSVNVALVLASLTSAFNLEPRESIIFSARTSGQVPGGRGSYFGFSVALHSLASENRTWVAVGAPRANSSFYDPEEITEPGAIFKCDLDSRLCEELIIDKQGNRETPNPHSDFLQHDLKNGGWLGGAMDSQPTSKAGRQCLGVCAPRWKNQVYGEIRMNGACYWLDASLPNATAHKKLPLLQLSKQWSYGSGSAGFSIHFPEDPTEMIVGAPGVLTWRGTVIRFKNTKPIIFDDSSRRRRRRRQSMASERHMFSSEFVMNANNTSIVKNDLLGYSVTSGNFLSPDKILYAAGATRGANSLGRVILFDFPQSEHMEMIELYKWDGTQIGENFGASLVAADITGDGLSDLVVGAPMYSMPDASDMGKVVVYKTTRQQGQATMESSDRHYYGSAKAEARFGTTLAACGDLNQDGFQDIAVGAPWEDGHGAVYIYLGSPQGLRARFSQHLLPQHFSVPFSGFGMSISRGIDIDGNGYPDLAIGSFLSGHAAVLKSRPVVEVTASITSMPLSVALTDTSLKLRVCFNYKDRLDVGIKGNITLDYKFMSPRAFFPDTNSYRKDFKQKDQRCKDYLITLKEDKFDAREPISVRAEWELDHSQSTNLFSQPVMDPSQPTTVTGRVGILTGCETDGDETCRVDLGVKATSSNQERASVIGSEYKPSVTISVFNKGEPAFLPNVAVSVDPPLALLLPYTHSCYFPSEDRSFLTCQLRNPIMSGEKDEVKVTLDTSQLDDRATNSPFRVQVAGEGTETRPQDNAIVYNLQMGASASLELNGYSREEQIIYQRLGDQMNTTVTPKFSHLFLLMKEGPTPLSEVELTVDIPVNFTTRGKSVKFLNIHELKTNFRQQKFYCSLTGASYVPDEEAGGEVEGGSAVLADSGRQTKQQQGTPTMRGKETSLESASLNCSNPMVSCARLSCLVKSWPSLSSVANVTVKLSLNLSVLARHISAKGAVLKSFARAKILSLNPELSFVGKNLPFLQRDRFCCDDASAAEQPTWERCSLVGHLVGSAGWSPAPLSPRLWPLQGWILQEKRT